MTEIEALSMDFMGNRTAGGVFGVVCTREAYRQFSLAQTIIRQYSVLAIFLATCSFVQVLPAKPVRYADRMEKRPKASIDWERNSLKG